MRLLKAVEGPSYYHRKWCFHNIKDERIFNELKLVKVSSREINFIFFNHGDLGAIELMLQNEDHLPKISKYCPSNTTSTDIERLFEKSLTFLQWMKNIMTNYGNRQLVERMLHGASSNYHFPTTYFLIGINNMLRNRNLIIENLYQRKHWIS